MSRIVKKSIAIPIIIATVLVAGGGIWAYSNHNQQDLPKLTSTNTQPQDNNSSDIEENDKNQDNTISDTRNNNSNSPNHTPKQYETPQGATPPQKSNTITGLINYKSVDSGVLLVRVTINQRLSSGNCKLTLTNSAKKTVTETAAIVAGPSSSTCKGFDVPVSKLSSGKWGIVINIASGNRQGIIQGNIDIS